MDKTGDFYSLAVGSIPTRRTINVLTDSQIDSIIVFKLGNLMKYTQEQIIELAKEVELTDMIDWEGLPLEKDRIYQIVGSQAYELYDAYTQSEDGEAILLATVTKLLVENFVLNLKVNSL